jgi:hypothetical protein
MLVTVEVETRGKKGNRVIDNGVEPLASPAWQLRPKRARLEPKRPKG